MAEENLDSLYGEVENALKDLETSAEKFKIISEKHSRKEITSEEWVGSFGSLLGATIALTAKVAKLSLALKTKIDAITKQ